MQLDGATCLENTIYDTCRWIETDMKPSPLATAIVSVLSGAREEIQKLRARVEELEKAEPKRVNGNPVLEPGRYAMVTSCDGHTKTIVDVEYIGGRLHWAYKDHIEYVPFNGSEKLMRIGQ